MATQSQSTGSFLYLPVGDPVLSFEAGEEPGMRLREGDGCSRRVPASKRHLDKKHRAKQLAVTLGQIVSVGAGTAHFTIDVLGFRATPQRAPNFLHRRQHDLLARVKVLPPNINANHSLVFVVFCLSSRPATDRTIWMPNEAVATVAN